jgi:colicin import membrane protein
MATFVYETPNEKAISGALALVMHVMFGVLLVFGVAWKKPEPVAMVAELWGNLPPVPAPKAAPPPPPKAEPEPPRPVPKVEPKPVPRVEPKPQPKAEIDLREKREKERKAKEQELAEKKKKEEQQRQELVKQQQAKEAAEAKRLAQEQADAQRKLAAQQAAAQAREIDKYKQAIAARIKRFIVEPPNLQGNPEVELDIIVLPGGEVLDVRTKRASGQTHWDNAVERAIRRAQPLPLPSDPALMKEFRELNLKFRPKE